MSLGVHPSIVIAAVGVLLALATVVIACLVRRQGRITFRNCSLYETKIRIKFVRLGEVWLSAKRSAGMEYQEQIRHQAQDGWRLVQVFAPGIGAYGAAKYYELILEREVSQ